MTDPIQIPITLTELDSCLPGRHVFNPAAHGRATCYCKGVWARINSTLTEVEVYNSKTNDLLFTLPALVPPDLSASEISHLKINRD